MTNPTRRQGMLLSVTPTDEGEQPRLVTEKNGIPTSSIGESVARGLIEGSQPIGSYGERTTAGAETNRIIWPNGTFSIPPAAGVQMALSSDSVNDTAGGTGVRTVEIHYLDANLNDQHEEVTLNGLTPVNTVATDIRFINCMHLQEVGSLLKADGNISAINSTVTYSYIAAGEVRCSSSARMVPAGKYCFVAGASASSVSGTSAARAVIRIVATELDNHQYLDPLIFMPFGSIAVQDSSEAFNFPIPLRFSEGTVIAFTETVDKAATVAGSWYGWIESV